VDDVSLMLDEIEWHMLRIKKMLDAFIASGPATDAELKTAIKAGLEGVVTPDPAAASEYSIN